MPKACKAFYSTTLLTHSQHHEKVEHVPLSLTGHKFPASQEGVFFEGVYSIMLLRVLQC